VKFLGLGDLHWLERSRLGECRRIHDYILELVRAHRPDGVLCGGDVYDGASTPYERSLVAQFWQAVAEVCPVIIAKGNHDRLLDCALLARLKSKHPIMVQEAAGIHRIGDALIAVVAWPERQSILSWSRAHKLEPDALEQTVLQNILRGLGAELAKHNGPKLALGHFMVSGASVSTGQPLLGQPMTVSLADLSLLQAPVVLMSHIHKPQTFEFGDQRFLYMGSPYRTSYGETEDKSVTLVEFDDDDDITPGRVLLGGLRPGAAPSCARLILPCAHMYLIDAEWEHDVLADGYALRSEDRWLSTLSTFPGDVSNAEIRLRYTVDPDRREAAAAVAAALEQKWYERGAADVKLDPCVRTSVRARAPEVAQATTLPDKLSALWNARNAMPDDARKERLFELASELERSTE
jgi:DNA repair exonuclease SbcCD nuclease subunit